MTAASMLALSPFASRGDNKALALGFLGEYLESAQPMERV